MTESAGDGFVRHLLDREAQERAVERAVQENTVAGAASALVGECGRMAKAISDEVRAHLELSEEDNRRRLVRNMTGRPNILDGVRRDTDESDVVDQEEAIRAYADLHLSEVTDDEQEVTQMMVRQRRQETSQRNNRHYAEGWSAFQDGMQSRECPYIDTNHYDCPANSHAAITAAQWWLAGWQDAMWAVLCTAQVQPDGPHMQPHPADMQRNLPPMPEGMGVEVEPEPEEVVNPGAQPPRRAIDVGD